MTKLSLEIGIRYAAKFQDIVSDKGLEIDQCASNYYEVVDKKKYVKNLRDELLEILDRYRIEDYEISLSKI